MLSLEASALGSRSSFIYVNPKLLNLEPLKLQIFEKLTLFHCPMIGMKGEFGHLSNITDLPIFPEKVTVLRSFPRYLNFLNLNLLND